KSLYIIRHAKAETFSFDKKDFDRPLLQDGINRVRTHALLLKEEVIKKEKKTLIVSSTAVRAAETATIFANIIAYPEQEIRWDPSIYEAHYLEILKSINDVSSTFDQLLIFGHNPGLSDLVEYISNEFISLKTASIACLTIEHDLDFSTLSANTASITK